MEQLRLCVAGFSLLDWHRQVDKMLPLFPHAHPRAVVKRFGMARLHAAFSSMPAVHMPDDLMSLIDEYAPITLPHLPLGADPAKQPTREEAIEAIKKKQTAQSRYAKRISNKHKETSESAHRHEQAEEEKEEAEAKEEEDDAAAEEDGLSVFSPTPAMLQSAWDYARALHFSESRRSTLLLVGRPR